jgi:ABC-type multidrug transport system fused ATPase/permease subunit
LHARGQKTAIALKQSIKLNHIQYRYPNAPQLALQNLSLTIPAKSTVGLVGSTGSGKTTTVDLILGLLEALDGTLTVDGQAITQNNRRAWQRAIGYVPQQIYLADDTVAANIAFGLDAKEIDQNAVERAAKIANLHDFVVNELPQQYQTTVGERGVRLSGGQRQRIAIARAMLKNPPLLLLDEATSALDAESERMVQAALESAMRGRTTLVIAHRLATVQQADRILVLDQGRVVEEGRHADLVKQGGMYARLAELQFTV